MKWSVVTEAFLYLARVQNTPEFPPSLNYRHRRIQNGDPLVKSNLTNSGPMGLLVVSNKDDSELDIMYHSASSCLQSRPVIFLKMLRLCSIRDHMCRF